MSDLPAVAPQFNNERALLPLVTDQKTAVEHLNALRTICKTYLVESTDYGKMPGTDKDTLFKSGAEKLMDVFGLWCDPQIEKEVEDYEKGLFDYRIKAIIKRRDNGSAIAAGFGSCSSWESRYRYVTKHLTCPGCGAENIKRSKHPDKNTGDMGWYCWEKTQGCGGNFSSTDARITGQNPGKGERPDMCDVKNTVLKQAEKRAMVGAVLHATRASELFTQDLEDLGDVLLPQGFQVVDVSEKKEEKKPAATKQNSGKAGSGTQQQTTTTATTSSAKTTSASSPKKQAVEGVEPEPASTKMQDSSKAGASTATSSTEDEINFRKNRIWQVAKARGWDGAAFRLELENQFELTTENAPQKLDEELCQQAEHYFRTVPVPQKKG